MWVLLGGTWIDSAGMTLKERISQCGVLRLWLLGGGGKVNSINVVYSSEL
jgi:hypothetical protein